jgi:two-component system, LuxR family, response regulator FixJ
MVDSMTAEPTVFIVDDDQAIRQSLQWLLVYANMNVETFASAEEFFHAFDPPRRGCLVLDLRMPGINGLTLQETLVREKIHLPIIFITGHGDVPQAVQAMKLGAIDFIEKPFDDHVLLSRIRQALAIDEKQRVDQSLREQIEQKLNRLSRREWEVAELLATGSANKEVARQLGLSIKTVEVHRANIMHKLEAGSLAEIVQMLTTYKVVQENRP